MINFENTKVMGFEDAIRGMRNPMNSRNKSDSGICKGGNSGIGCSNCSDYCNNICDHGFDNKFKVGKNDFELMLSLAKSGSVHAKYRRMIIVYTDIIAPLYWWKEFDTYKVGTVANSCSTMHKIHEKELTLDDFSCEHLKSAEKKHLSETIYILNAERKEFIGEGTDPTHKENKIFWWQMIQLLPSSYNQRRTVMMNYEVLSNIYFSRRNHKLDEWINFCDWITDLPYSKLCTYSSEEDD